MKALAMSYFKDDREQWHQPGNVDDFSPEEAEKHEAAGAIRIIRTAMTETPETRGQPPRRKQR